MNKEVKKKEEKRLLEEYVAPECEVLVLENETQLLAASPNVKPGKGGSGNINIIGPGEDEDDDELEG